MQQVYVYKLVRFTCQHNHLLDGNLQTLQSYSPGNEMILSCTYFVNYMLVKCYIDCNEEAKARNVMKLFTPIQLPTATGMVTFQEAYFSALRAYSYYNLHDWHQALEEFQNLAEYGSYLTNLGTEMTQEIVFEMRKMGYTIIKVQC